MPQRPSRIPPLIAALLLVFTTAMIDGLRTNIRSHAEALEAHLHAHRP